MHGTDGEPESNWFPWLKQKLEERGYEVWVPQLPECHTPNRETYAKFLLARGWDFADNVVIGHSSGAVEVLNLLNDDRFPKLKLAMAVSAWAEGDPLDGGENWLEKGQFVNLFPPAGFDFVKMRTKTRETIFFHSTNDPYCPMEQAEYLSENLDAPLIKIQNGGHLGSDFSEFPELWRAIESNL